MISGAVGADRARFCKFPCYLPRRPRANPPREAGGPTISLGAGSFSTATYGEAPRISLALSAKALVVSSMVASCDGGKICRS